MDGGKRAPVLENLIDRFITTICHCRQTDLVEKDVSEIPRFQRKSAVFTSSPAPSGNREFVLPLTMNAEFVRLDGDVPPKSILPPTVHSVKLQENSRGRQHRIALRQSFPICFSRVWPFFHGVSNRGSEKLRPTCCSLLALASSVYGTAPPANRRNCASMHQKRRRRMKQCISCYLGRCSRTRDALSTRERNRSITSLAANGPNRDSK